MQLKHRIKKIENAVGINQSENCNCHGQIKIEVLPITIDEWKRRWETGEETILPLPAKCAVCGKVYDRRFIEESFADHKAKVAGRIRQVEETWHRHNE